MTKRQKMLVKWWLIMLVMFIVFWAFQGNMLIAYGSFALVAFYAVWNASEIRELERKHPTPLDIIQSNKYMKLWVFGSLLIEIIAAMYFLASGRDLGVYIMGFGTLALVVVAPLCPPIFLSQLALYRALADDEH